MRHYSGFAFTTDKGPLSIIKSYDSIYTSTSGSLEPTVQTVLGVGVGMRTV